MGIAMQNNKINTQLDITCMRDSIKRLIKIAATNPKLTTSLLQKIDFLEIIRYDLFILQQVVPNDIPWCFRLIIFY
jgi:hypothetical protein